jgi:hypothetical protein
MRSDRPDNPQTHTAEPGQPTLPRHPHRPTGTTKQIAPSETPPTDAAFPQTPAKPTIPRDTITIPTNRHFHGWRFPSSARKFSAHHRSADHVTDGRNSNREIHFEADANGGGPRSSGSTTPPIVLSGGGYRNIKNMGDFADRHHQHHTPRFTQFVRPRDGPIGGLLFKLELLDNCPAHASHAHESNFQGLDEGETSSQSGNRASDWKSAWRPQEKTKGVMRLDAHANSRQLQFPATVKEPPIFQHSQARCSYQSPTCDPPTRPGGEVAKSITTTEIIFLSRKTMKLTSLRPENGRGRGSSIVGGLIGAGGKASPNNRAPSSTLNRDLPGRPKLKSQAELAHDREP